jgi:hypothetical protein
MIVQMHQTLLSLEDNTINPAMMEEVYEVECFKE